MVLMMLQASYFIFEKMKLEGFAGAEGEVRLRTVISIPQSAAGRVVGKGGKNVREIQRSTGSIITLPSVDMNQQSLPGSTESAAVDAAAPLASADVQVEVFGNFIATQVNKPTTSFQFTHIRERQCMCACVCGTRAKIEQCTPRVQLMSNLVVLCFLFQVKVTTESTCKNVTMLLIDVVGLLA